MRPGAACAGFRHETKLGLEAELGSLFACLECGVELEAVALDPPRFSLAHE